MTVADEINRGPWTKDEDETLRELVNSQQLLSTARQVPALQPSSAELAVEVYSCSRTADCLSWLLARNLTQGSTETSP